MLPDSLMEQDQRFTDMGGPVLGDCYRTALACLLEVPRDTVPHFVDLYRDHGNLGWWTESIFWVELIKPGWTLTCVRPRFPVYQDVDDCPRRVVVTGKSPRGDWNHCVVADSITGEMLWDPFPTRAGVDSQLDIICLTEKTVVNVKM